MIELFAIYKFCKLFGRQVRAKGRDPFLIQLLFIVLWFVGEFMGAVFGFAISGGATGGTYLCALLGAGGAAALVFQIVRGLRGKDQALSTGGFPVETAAGTEQDAQQ